MMTTTRQKPSAPMLLLLLSLSLLLLLSPAEAAEAILLQDIRALTLHRDRMTTGRRTSPIPQLQCIGEACGYFQPAVVQCTNQGFDGRDFQWRCSAEMEDLYRFGAVTVLCEGYTHPDDPYVLVGSCGLEYELKLTEKGRERYYQQRASSGHRYDYGYDASPSSVGTIISIIWVVVFAIILFSCLGSFTGRQGPPRPFPTAPYPNPNMNGAYYDSPPSYTQSYAPPPSGGGYWSGMATGGFLGYLFGRNRTPGYGYPRTSPGYVNTTYSSPHSGFSSPSSSSHTSEGYGGTRRR